jgi:putative oxidoreductase
MKKFLLGTKAAYADLSLLMLRLAAGGFMAFSHGWPKFNRAMEGDMGFADPIGVGETPSLILTIFAEMACGVLVAAGLFTRLALIPLIVTMAVAVFIIHADDPFGDKEHALLFLVPYVALLFTGPGKWSLDALVRKA